MTTAPRRRTLGVLVAVATLAGVTACTGGSGGATPSAAPVTSGSTSGPAATAGSIGGPLAWSPCQGRKSFDCATLAVPLDHADPAGRTISLALIRARATSGKSVGSLLINPGGPGESTVEQFDGLLEQLSSDLRSRFDIVGFDPRGVGSSTPVHCTDDAGIQALVAADPDPPTAAGRTRTVEDAQKLVAGCTADSGDLLPYIDTEQTARDMDDIRAAVGDAKLTYLGFSYGTLLGATYAHLFPDNVRALALDGAVDPMLSPFQGLAVQSVGFQKVLDAFLAECAAQNSCAWRPRGDLATALRQLYDRIRLQPLRTTLGDRVLHVGEAYTGTLAALYSRQAWGTLAAALAQASAGDGTLLLRLCDAYTGRRSDGTFPNVVAANLAVNCRDAQWPSDPAAYLTEAETLRADAPDVGPANVLASLPCAFWPAVADAPPTPPSYGGSPPVVVVGTTDDPATPFQEAQALTTELGNAVLVTRVGDEHTAYAVSACVRQYVDAYLIDGTVPPTGAHCDS